MNSSRLVAIVLLVLVLFGGVLAWRIGAAGDDPVSLAVNDDTTTTVPDVVGFLVTREGALLAEQPGAGGRTVGGGIVFPVTGDTGDGYQVIDNCNRPGWLSADQVDPGLVPTERAEGMAGAVFVIDPGHGFPDLGAVGPSGLTETEANIDVAQRLVDLLGSPHDIDWVTGTVGPGSGVPAAAAAIMTRYPTGPNEGDYELGLTFRAELGNAVDATALVSIHHNTEPTRDLDHPGTAAFVSATNRESSRLGGLIVDELLREFSTFEADWVGGDGNGLNARVGEDGEDYYTLLERSEGTAVIVEGAYISNPSEEALIATGEFRQAYAEGVYRALVRFVTTDEEPLPPPDPELYDVDAPPRSMEDCIVPTR